VLQERRETPVTLDEQDLQERQEREETPDQRAEEVDGRDPSGLRQQEGLFRQVLAVRRVRQDRPDSPDRLDQRGGLALEGIQVGPEELDPPAQLPSQETLDPRAGEVDGRDPSDLRLREGLFRRVLAVRRVQPVGPDSLDRLDRQGGLALEGIPVAPEELDPPAQLPSQETPDQRAAEVAGRDPSDLRLQEALSQRVRAAQQVQRDRPDSPDRLDQRGGVVLAVRRV
jgi:hypothetical protein